MTFCKSNVAPDAIVVPAALVPSALFVVTARVPLLIVVRPVYSLLPDRVKVPDPALVRIAAEPVPSLMIPVLLLSLLKQDLVP